jgi:type IV pilus assembly protein PilM
MTYMDALDMMRNGQYIGETLRSAREDNMVVRREITGSLSMLVGNISRVLDYYFSRNTDVDLNRIVLVGLGADCRGMDRLLSNELDVYVETAHKFGQSDIGRGLERHGFRLAEYYSCLGSTIAPLKFNFEVQGEKKQGSLRLPALVFVGCLAVSAVLLGTQLMSNLMLKAENESMVRTLQSKQAAIDTYNEYVTNKMINQEMLNIDKSTELPNDLFLEFLDEMQACVPKDLIVANIATSSDEIAMTLTCSSLVSAADTIVQIRQFRTVKVVTCSQLNEEETDDGIKTVEFSVTMTYNTDLLNEDDSTGTVLDDGTVLEEGTEAPMENSTESVN